jgi:hypothetical protein
LTNLSVQNTERFLAFKSKELEYTVTKTIPDFLANGEDLARQNEMDPPIRTDPD